MGAPGSAMVPPGGGRGVRARIGLLAVSLAALLWGFHGLILYRAPGMFRAVEEDMSFGWYVPLFSLYVLWAERRELARSIGAPGWGGLVLALPMLALGFLGARGLQLRLEIVAFAGLLIALPWAFFGRATAKRVMFPALFLLFCIPLNTYLDVVTVHLRLLASSTAFAVLKGFGAAVVQQGTMIGSADGSFMIDVAEPCSGLRSIFALMALTAAYAYLSQPTWLRRGLLFATSIPLAILGNVMRILTICLVANYADQDFATGFYHDYSGYVVFVVAIALMVAIDGLINRIAGGKGRRNGGEADAPAPEQGAGPGADSAKSAGTVASFAIPALALAVVVPAMFCQARSPKVTVAEPPEAHLGEMAGYESRELEPSEAELTVLPRDTRIEKRVYTEPGGDWFQVSVIVGGTSKSSIHRPELCLPSQGYLMIDPHTVEVDGIDWRFITVAEGAARRTGFAYTFFNQDGYRTSSHVRRILRDIWDRSIHNRIDRWVMVTVGASRAGDAHLQAFLMKLKGIFE